MIGCECSMKRGVLWAGPSGERTYRAYGYVEVALSISPGPPPPLKCVPWEAVQSEPPLKRGAKCLPMAGSYCQCSTRRHRLSEGRFGDIYQRLELLVPFGPRNDNFQLGVWWAQSGEVRVHLKVMSRFLCPPGMGQYGVVLDSHGNSKGNFYSVWSS